MAVPRVPADCGTLIVGRVLLVDERITGRVAIRGGDDESRSPASLFDLVVARHTAMISRIALAHEADPAPLAQKQAIILCLKDFTFKEIGVTLGISTRAVAMRCHRARAALRSAMENWS